MIALTRMQKWKCLKLMDKLGDTALKKAIKFKRIDVVELLIEYGANIQSENIENSPWFVARENKKNSRYAIRNKRSYKINIE